MSRWLKNANDLDDVVPPTNASKSRELDGLAPAADPTATAKAAAALNYQFHGGQCTQCGDAQNEAQLCGIGRSLYAKMRACGVVG